jgi:hypothetical protein
MEKIFTYITKNIISVIGIAILTGTTLTTSALGVMKVANNFEKIKLEVPEVKEIESISPSSSPTPAESVNNLTTGTVPHRTPPLPTTIPKINTSTTQASTTSVGCAITLFGKQYDVTNLRSTHSGGDIFNCGTDMTAVYQGRHGSSVSRMQQYLISSGGTTGSTAITNTSGGSGTTSTGSSSTEIGRDGEHKEEREIEDRKGEERHDEDREEEEKEHLESFIHKLLQLVVS